MELDHHGRFGYRGLLALLLGGLFFGFTAFLAVPLGCLFVVAAFADEQLLRLRGRLIGQANGRLLRLRSCLVGRA